MSIDAKNPAPSGDVPVEVTTVRPSADKDNAADNDAADSKSSDGNISPIGGKENLPLTDAAVPEKESSDNNSAVAQVDEENTALTKDAEPKKKKKKSKKSKSLKKKATGFEGELDAFLHTHRKPMALFIISRFIDMVSLLEYFCDPPITPAEFQEERNSIYPPSRPFVDRIEECIQRYRARRRFDSDKEQLFSRYLFLGGIDTSVRQFQGTASLTKRDLDGLDKDDIREISANDFVGRKSGLHGARYYNDDDPEHWEVDFTGVAAGFLLVQLVSSLVVILLTFPVPRPWLV